VQQLAIFTGLARQACKTLSKRDKIPADDAVFLSGERKLAVLNDPLTPNPSPPLSRGRGEKCQLAVFGAEKCLAQRVGGDRDRDWTVTPEVPLSWLCGADTIRLA